MKKKHNFADRHSDIILALVLGNGMGLQNPHGSQVWVATGTGAGTL